MANDPDTGLIKRGMILLIVMLLLVSTVLFIIFQGRRSAEATPSSRAADYAWSVALPSAPFPANVSWAALYGLADYAPSPIGWEIRQNATATLARRGSDHVPWSLFGEMLDLKRATVNVRLQTPDSQEPPEPTAQALVIAALKAVAEWHTVRRAAGKTGVPEGLQAVYDRVDQLAANPVPEIREQARTTQATFFRG
jgi:hypothetical protein